MSRRDYEFEDFCDDYNIEYFQDNHVFSSKCKRHKNKNTRKSMLDYDDSWPESDYDRDEIN